MTEKCHSEIRHKDFHSLTDNQFSRHTGTVKHLITNLHTDTDREIIFISPYIKSFVMNLSDIQKSVYNELFVSGTCQ